MLVPVKEITRTQDNKNSIYQTKESEFILFNCVYYNFVYIWLCLKNLKASFRKMVEVPEHT